jgi:ribonuclease PH
MARTDGRTNEQIRPTHYHWDIAPNALASILLSCGQTQVVCAVSHEAKVPKWKESQQAPGGWITAEYSMLPYSTPDRKQRDITKGRIDGRSQEIQRLIGRSLRTMIDLEKLERNTLWIDCDVLAADGGTRTTAITGASLALQLAVERLQKKNLLASTPLQETVAATSVGLLDGIPLLDLCYVEDRDVQVDMNVVMTRSGRLVEVQASGEEATFSRAEFDRLVTLAEAGIRQLEAVQDEAWNNRPQSAPVPVSV